MENLIKWNVWINRDSKPIIMNLPFNSVNKAHEFICELEDYSDEDIQMYMQTQIGDASKDETHMFEQAFNGMTNYLLTGKREEDG